MESDDLHEGKQNPRRSIIERSLPCEWDAKIDRVEASNIGAILIRLVVRT